MAYSQSNTNNNNTNDVTKSTTNLPVLLIHGYMEDVSVWNKSIDLLKKDDIYAVYPITFKQTDYECSSAANHAKELSKIGDNTVKTFQQVTSDNISKTITTTSSNV